MHKFRHILLSKPLYYYLIAVFLLILGLNINYLLILLVIYLFYFNRKYHLYVMISILIFFSIFFYLVKNKNIPKQISGKYTVISSEQLPYNNKVTIIKGFNKYLIYTKDNYEVGSIINVEGIVSEFKVFYTPGSFDFQKYHFSNGVLGEIKDYHLSNTNKKNYLYSFSKYLKDPHLKLLFGGEFNNEEVSETISLLNIYYLISLSGIHLYLLIKILKRIMYEFNVDINNQNKAIIILITIVLIFSNYQTTIIRILFYQLLKHLKQKESYQITNYSLMNLSFMLTIFIKPYLMFNKGYLIAYIIVSAMQLFKPLLMSTNFIIRQLKINVLISIVQLAFYSTTNVLSVVFSPLYYFVFIYIVFPLSLINNVVNVNLITNFNNKIINSLKVTNFINFKITFYNLNAILIVLYFILIFSLIISQKKKIIVGFLLILLLIIPSFKRYIYGERFYFLDVGQGDSFVYISKELVIVVDAYQNVSNFLKYEGISKIDYLILSHSHSDHMMEANQLINDFKVSYIVLSANDEYLLNDGNYQIIKPSSGDVISNYVKFEFFGPIKKYRDSNDNSLVFKLITKSQSVLFTGDIELASELDLINKYGYRLKSNILKVAHHGSQTSSNVEFLSYVSPNYAIISLGRNNKYGFPSVDTINSLLKESAIIYRTDLDGTILINEQSKIKVYKK